MSESQRTFVLTGATGVVAPQVARTLLARGDRLMLTGRDPERLEAVRASLDSEGEVDALAAQITDPDAADAVVARAIERFGPLDGLVALAGAFRAGTPVALADPSVYLDLYEANVLSAAMASRAVLRRMEGPGWFIYLTSTMADAPMPTMGPYAASKAALTAFVRSLSREVKDRDIRANLVAISLVDSPEYREERGGGDPSQWVPIEHVAEAIAFFTSPAANSFHGSVIPMPGRFALVPTPGAIGGGGPPPGMGPGGPPPGAGP